LAFFGPKSLDADVGFPLRLRLDLSGLARCLGQASAVLISKEQVYEPVLLPPNADRDRCGGFVGSLLGLGGVPSACGNGTNAHNS
jgi:hypothetical protein